MKLVKTRVSFLTILLNDGSQVVFNNSDAVAYKDANGQWYRVRDVRRYTRKVLNLYFHRAQVDDNIIEKVSWDAMNELVGRI